MKNKAHFVLSRHIVLDKLNELRTIADDVSYSFKTNYEVGQVLEDNSNCMFSVHSLDALEELHDMSRVWLFAQAWDIDTIAELIRKGVRQFVVDNESDLKVLEHVLEKVPDLEVALLLRMRLKEHTVHTGKHFVFGFYSSSVNEHIVRLRENPQIVQLGIHFHRKTQNIAEWGIKSELEQSLTPETLAALDIVNIGGGLPAVYKNYRAEVIKGIFDRISELRTWLHSHNVKMIIEPGRFIAAPAVELHASIINIYDNTLIVGCSIYNSAMDTFIANIRLIVTGELESGESYTIKGYTPDSLDIFRYRVYLNNPQVGDVIVFKNAGAYNFSTEFCQLKRLETKIVD